MPRTITHKRETDSRDMIRKMINSFYENGDALVREWSERDYGIDFVVELFSNGYPTGKIAYLQIKGTTRFIEKLKTSNEVSCAGVSVSSTEYARQNRIPFILIYASTYGEGCFYYCDLNSKLEEIDASIVSKPDRSTLTIRIPHENYVEADMTGFFELINSYY